MPSPTESTPQPPRQAMGQYYLLEKIGRGGMAEIYKGLAYDLHGIKRTVVIKKILPQATANREFIDMLIAEAKIAVMLSHGNIAQIYDLGKAGDDYFIVMEYVEGQSISQVQRECAARKMPIPIPIACYLCAEVASGLDYMHQRMDESGQPLHIVHRDVSPQNVLISYSGTVKIIDFGIAKARTKLEDTDIGVLKGKFAYMSPEHARGDSIDHRSDIFSLGVILHELLTGKRLFKAKEHRETLKNVRRAQVQAPSTLRADVPTELDAIVLRALAKAREGRYSRAALMRDDLLKVVLQHYPDFRDHQLADFIRQLFVDAKVINEDDPESKTPFLIIDHTQSAIAPNGREPIGLSDESIPAVMAEFMLPDLVEAAQPSPVLPPVSSGLAEDDQEPSVTMHQPRWLAWGRWWWEWPRIALWVTLGGIAWALIMWQHGAWSPQNWWQRFFPATIMRNAPTEALAVHAATLTLDSTPTGAAIYLDDVETGMYTPATMQGLIPERTCQVGMHLTGYKYWSVTKTFAPDARERLSAALEIDYGRLSVVTTPTGAQVEMNGHIIGVTPLQREQMIPDHVIAIRLLLPGYETIAHTYRVRAGQTIDVRESLVRQRKKSP